VSLAGGGSIAAAFALPSRAFHGQNVGRIAPHLSITTFAVLFTTFALIFFVFGIFFLRTGRPDAVYPDRGGSTVRK